MEKVSVIIPCYNQGSYIEECIKSVLNQTYLNIEIIVIDDGSTDKNTKKVLEKIKSIDKRLSVISINNSGVCIARNIGVERSTGKYIVPLDADDKIESTFIEQCINVFNKKNNVDVVYTLGKAFGYKNGIAVFQRYLPERIITRNLVFCTAMYKRKDFNIIKGYNPNMIYGYEDWDFWLSMTEKNKKFYRIDRILFYYRIKEESRNSNISNDIKREEKMLRQIYLNHIKLYSKFNITTNELIRIYRENKKSTMKNKIKYGFEKIKISLVIALNKIIYGRNLKYWS